MTIRSYILSGLLLIGSFISLSAQTPQDELMEKLNYYLGGYLDPDVKVEKIAVDSIKIDNESRKLDVFVNLRLAYIPLRQENVQQIYQDFTQLIPREYQNYKLTILSGERAIDQLIPNYYSQEKDRHRLFRNIEYRGKPWTNNLSKPFTPTKGLDNRHIALWQSHGYYYDVKRKEWRWQRPRLYGTTEDQFTQSIVLPFLIPMLENAGAVVYTPRERDIQTHEVVVDNDGMQFSRSEYREIESVKSSWMQSDSVGFAYWKRNYNYGENPFKTGTTRYAFTERSGNALIQWVPDIPETGEYAVYVSYQTLPRSISDAHYCIYHSGIVTEIQVNQQMGGGTWVYLGTYHFTKGRNLTNMVTLSNESREDGIVTADAIRLGGGMGNMLRDGTLSGMPRYLEGARYWAQWAGMNDSIYSTYEGKNDYNDDINVRSKTVNYLSGGSIFNPDEVGMKVPFETVFSVHSDAGIAKEDSIFGSLTVYTTDFNEGLLASGVDRYASRDLADLIHTQVVNDIRSTYPIYWRRRAMWDRNYSETRLPAMPSAILETLSHQNFEDMRFGHDPNFKFTLARAIYKAVLRFISTQHGDDYTVQPLPISHFASQFSSDNTLQLSWQPVTDPLEPTATPDAYLLYTRIGDGDFDNGVRVNNTSLNIQLQPNVLYSFKVTAINKGGESMPSETLSAYKSSQETAKILVVNGFDRIAPPAVINTEEEAGFDFDADPGVAYHHDISTGGRQINFSRKAKESVRGDSGKEWEGLTFGGNTFDYPYIHGQAIAHAVNYSFSSTSDEALEAGYITPEGYAAIDYILGMEKDDPNARPLFGQRYKTFSPEMQRIIRAYTAIGGNIFVSGAYIGCDMQGADETRFTQNVLKYQFGAQHRSGNNTFGATGMNRTVQVPSTLNAQSFAVCSAD
ncbi:MAG: N-acetylmuramoyl-L-alanine amidase, partial [Bacteroidaceae bacterium]|nr:N-acetylmuramoyl-L-alanine amidase [Bacteroidaceae bacterium]